MNQSFEQALRMLTSKPNQNLAAVNVINIQSPLLQSLPVQPDISERIEEFPPYQKSSSLCQ